MAYVPCFYTAFSFRMSHNQMFCSRICCLKSKCPSLMFNIKYLRYYLMKSLILSSQYEPCLSLLGLFGLLCQWGLVKVSFLLALALSQKAERFTLIWVNPPMCSVPNELLSWGRKSGFFFSPSYKTRKCSFNNKLQSRR